MENDLTAHVTLLLVGQTQRGSVTVGKLVMVITQLQTGLLSNHYGVNSSLNPVDPSPPFFSPTLPPCFFCIVPGPPVIIHESECFV